MFDRVVIFGDEFGLPVLLDIIPKKKIIAVVIASNRSENYDHVKKITGKDLPLLIQPGFLSADYSKFYKSIEALKPDCLFCNSYSMLIKEDILRLIHYHAFNIHASFLPYNRGPNPIQWAIIRGNEYTGVTIHCMDPDFDTGKIVNQLKVPIDIEDTWVTLRDKLVFKIVEICQQTIPVILNGNFPSKVQDESIATKNYRLTEDYPKIDFNTMSDIEIYNLIRAQVKPLKGAYVLINKKKYYFDSYQSLDSISQLRELYSHS